MMNFLQSRKAKITLDEQRPHPEGGTFRLVQGHMPDGQTFEVKEHQNRFMAKANDDKHTTDVNMDEGQLVKWFMKMFGE